MAKQQAQTDPTSQPEKRKFPRDIADITIRYSRVGSAQSTNATCVNLSATGLLFNAAENIPVGTALNVHIQSDNPLALPLNALVETKRVTKIGDNDYHIAVAIEGLKGV